MRYFCKRIRILGLYVYITTSRMKRRSRADIAYSRRHDQLMRIKRELYRKRRCRCESCGERFPIERLQLHHKIPRSERPDLLLDKSNIELMCEACHKRVHREIRAERWRRWEESK